MAGRKKRNGRKARKARAKHYHPAVVVRTHQARHLQMLADNEAPEGEIRLDPALRHNPSTAHHYVATTVAVVSSAALAVSELFKR